MKLIKSKAEILDNIDGQAILERIEQVARTCYKSEPKYGYEYKTDTGYTVIVTEEAVDSFNKANTALDPTGRKVSTTAEKLVKRLIESKHEAMLEFVDITVKFTCSRAISHELVRHRIASFAQESQRYCNYSKDKFNNEITYIIPSWVSLPEGNYTEWDNDWCDMDELKIQYPNIQDNTKINYLLQSLKNSEYHYFLLLNSGCSPQEAREVLPNATKTEINMKANLREWRHFLKLRCHSTAHPDMQLLAKDLLKQLHEKIPVVFDDLYEEYIK